MGREQVTAHYGRQQLSLKLYCLTLRSSKTAQKLENSMVTLVFSLQLRLPGGRRRSSTLKQTSQLRGLRLSFFTLDLNGSTSRPIGRRVTLDMLLLRRRSSRGTGNRTTKALQLPRIARAQRRLNLKRRATSKPCSIRWRQRTPPLETAPSHVEINSPNTLLNLSTIQWDHWNTGR